MSRVESSAAGCGSERQLFQARVTCSSRRTNTNLTFDVTNRELPIPGPSRSIVVITGANTQVVPEHAGLQLHAQQMLIADGALLTHRPATANDTYDLNLFVSADLTISATGALDVSGKGYLPGYTLGNTTAGGATGLSGGSHGGAAHDLCGATNLTYGDPKRLSIQEVVGLRACTVEPGVVAPL